MTKKSVIILSILCGLLVVTGILFGAVFCLRKQDVKVIGETPISVSREEIISAAGLENGKSIFMLDKEKAINKIEAKYSHIKVIQIKTTSVMSIEICVRARHEMFYVQANEKYYVLDEDLKVLDILDTTSAEPTNLTKINADAVQVGPATMKCDFVGTKEQQKNVYEFYRAMRTVVTKQDGENETYINREDIKDLISDINFEYFQTYNKIIVTTKYGVVLDIERPDVDIQGKINICFSTIESFIENANNKEKSGTIKLFYDINNVLQTVYIP